MSTSAERNAMTERQSINLFPAQTQTEYRKGDEEEHECDPHYEALFSLQHTAGISSKSFRDLA